jgi:lysophospholipid acyltransferase (LPLAT)-like uncharacterized protein
MPATASVQKTSGVIVPRALSLRRRAGGAIVLAAMRLFMQSWRCRWTDPHLCHGLPGPVIFCFWHNRLALAMAAYDDFVRAQWPSAGLCAMISASRDGGFLAGLVEPFGVIPIRGSTSRRGPQALLEATTWMEKNYSIAITPDGPRGPVYKIQPGIIVLAQLTGRPIIPLSTYTRFRVTMRSWDKFQIPLPFARCVLRYGPPVWVPRDATPAVRDQCAVELEKNMMSITRD